MTGFFGCVALPDTEQMLQDENFQPLIVARIDETLLRHTIISPHLLHEMLENLAAAREGVRPG